MIKIPITHLLLLVSITTLSSERNEWQEQSIDEKHFSFSINSDHSNQLLLVHNQTVDSYCKYTINGEDLYSASWMGEGGFYVVFIPANSGLVTLEIGKVDQSAFNETVRLKTFTLQDNEPLISELKNFATGLNTRYSHFLKIHDNIDGVYELYTGATKVFIESRNDTLAAISSFESAAILSERGNYISAIELFEQSIFYWEQSKNLKQINITLNRIGLDQWRSHQYNKAIITFNKVLEKTKNNQILLKAQVFNNLGLINWEMQELVLAKENFMTSLNIYDIDELDTTSIEDILLNINQSEYKKDISTTINNLALVNDSLGSPQMSEKLFTVFLNISSGLTDQDSYAKANHSLGVHLLTQGRYEEAKYYFEKSLSLLIYSDTNRWLYMNYYFIGQLSIELGLYRLAEIQFNQAAKYIDELNSPKNYVALSYKMAQIYRLKNDIKKSLEITDATFEKAKKINSLRVSALLHINKYHIFKSQNNWTLADKELELAIKALKNKPFKRLRAKINTFKAGLHLRNNNVIEAIRILKHEVNNLKTIWDTKQLNTANNLLAQAYLKNNQPLEAENTIIEELKNIKFYTNSSANNKIRSSLSQMLKESLSIYIMVVNRLGKSESAFIKTNQMLSRLNDLNSLKGQKSSSIDQISVDDLLSQIESKSIALENGTLSDNDREHIQNDIIELKAKLDFSYIASDDFHDIDVSFQSVQDKLDDSSLVVQFSIGQAGGVAWWISKNKVETHVITNKKELSQLVKLSHYEFIRKAHSHKSIKELSSVLLSPLKHFDNIDKIYFILDEPINLVPFNALFDPREPKMQVLAVNTNIKRLSSIQSLSNLSNKQSINRKNLSALVIADPVTSINDNRLPIDISVDNSQPFGRLVGTKSEAENIGKIINAKIIQGFDASKENLYSTGFKDKNILHFATHAFFHPEISGLSSIVLSQYNKEGKSLWSSYLRALEISQLDINADLVVLSGCETGVSKYDNSLGLAGLTQSFMQAGAKNLIASLWKVNDRVTEKMMTEFYRGYANGLSIELALAQAQKLIRETRHTRHPKYWAGWFLLVD